MEYVVVMLVCHAHPNPRVRAAQTFRAPALHVAPSHSAPRRLLRRQHSRDPRQLLINDPATRRRSTWRACTFIPSTMASNAAARCNAFSSTFTVPGLTSINSTYLTQNSAFALPPLCGGGSLKTSVNVCYVAYDIATTSSSSTHYDVWLPDTWNGRMLATGTGGLSGCTSRAFLSKHR